MIDQPKALREEDALDEVKIDAFVKKNIEGIKGNLQIKQFLGGASNLTYQLDYENRSLILRTSPKGTKAKGAHNMAREFQIMQTLKPVFPHVPNMFAYSDDDSIIGREFYIMEKLSGIIPRANLPKSLVISELEINKLCKNTIDHLVKLHQIDLKTSGLEQFGKGEGYVERQIDGWCFRYEKAKTWNVPSFDAVKKYLKNNIPKQGKLCFIHNDFRFDNVVFDAENPTEIIGILDWELATVGDPLMDLGSSLAYWVQADDDFIFKNIRRQPTHLQGMLTRKEVVAYYLEKMGMENTDFRFYEVYGLFRLAGIIQQIYYRYHHRQTTNPTFKRLWLMVNYLNWRCKRLLP
jgi:aminoglycoside phosphotransferase (APT) family kinase protein